MKTRKRIRRLLKELRELQHSGSAGNSGGISVIWPQETMQRMNSMRWNNYKGIGS